MVCGEAANTNLTVFGLIPAVASLEPTIYCTGGDHVIYYTTDAVCTYIITLQIDSGYCSLCETEMYAFLFMFNDNLFN